MGFLRDLWHDIRNYEHLTASPNPLDRVRGMALFVCALMLGATIGGILSLIVRQ